jgi:hypothetical protein
LNVKRRASNNIQNKTTASGEERPEGNTLEMGSYDGSMSTNPLTGHTKIKRKYPRTNRAGNLVEEIDDI